MRWVGVLVIACGCGRIDFDPRPAGSGPGGPTTLVSSCETNADLIVCYDFDDSVRDAVSGMDLAATQISYVPGVAGDALAVTATSDVRRVDDPLIAIGPSVTVEAWFRLDELTGARQGIVDKQYEIGAFVDATMELECGSSAAGGALKTGMVQLGRWTHIACIQDAAGDQMYIDGELVAQGSGNSVSDNTYDLTIGQNSPSGEFFVGAIDAVRIWRRALTPAEICADAGCP